VLRQFIGRVPVPTIRRISEATRQQVSAGRPVASLYVGRMHGG
jgi:hypothetical protein